MKKSSEFIYFSHSIFNPNSGASFHDFLFFESLTKYTVGQFIPLKLNSFYSEKFTKLFFPARVLKICLMRKLRQNNPRFIVCGTGDSFFLGFLPKKIRPKIILISHGLEGLWYDENNFLRLRRKFFNSFILFPMVNSSLKKADFFIALNSKEFDFARRIRGKSDNYLSSCGFVENSKKILLNHSSKRRLVFLGNFDYYRKGIDLIINLLNNGFHADDIEGVLFAGIGIEGAVKISDILSTTISYKILETYTRNELAEILQDGDVVLIPSRFEGSPLIMFEILSMGLAPVISNIASSIDWIEDGKNGTLFDSGNLISFEIALRKHLERKFDENTVRESIEYANWDTIMGERIKYFQQMGLF